MVPGMNKLDDIKKDPFFCKHCNKITEFVFQVAKNTNRGQYQGFVCPTCQNFKGTKFIPYKTKKDHDRIWEKDYRV